MTPQINTDLVVQLEKLAGLRLAPAERNKVILHLEQVLAYCEQIAELATDSADPCTHPSPGICRRREDQLAPSLTVDQALDQAPSRQQEFFTVPSVREPPAQGEDTG